MERWFQRNVPLLGMVIFGLGTLPLFHVIDTPAQFDVRLYEKVALDIQEGSLPYRDRVLEYPPYAVLLFLLPHIDHQSDYVLLFKIFAWAADTCIKLGLISMGLRSASGVCALVPLFSYTVSVSFLSYLYLQRYDVFPALVCLLALAALFVHRFALSGALFAVGAGLKLYPLLFLPVALVISWRQRKARSFMAGTAAGFLPLIVLALFVPWWRFLEYHQERGLQVESLYAAALWLVHLCGFGELKWETGHGCKELHGLMADRVLPWARVAFSGAVVGSTLLACWAGSRQRVFLISNLAQLFLLPLLAFVAFNQVLSPQYLVWLLPMTALACLETDRWIAWAMLLVSILTYFVYPSRYYMSGLHPFMTAVLMLRNFTLVWIWLRLATRLFRKDEGNIVGCESIPPQRMG